MTQVNVWFRTCDVDNAGTDDDVQITLQTKNKIKTYTLDNPGDDRERDSVETYVLPGGGSFTDLKAVTVSKSGRDGWCIEDMGVQLNGVTVWSLAGFTTNPSGMSVGTTKYVGPYAVSASQFWIDDDSSDAPSPFLRLSDLTMAHDRAKPFAPIKLAVETCDVADAGTDDEVLLHWSHDGIVETMELDNSGDDRRRGGTDTYVIDPTGRVGTIDWMKLEIKGDDGWCIKRSFVALRTLTTTPTWLDDSATWVMRNQALTGISGSASSTSYANIPLARGGLYASSTSLLNSSVGWGPLFRNMVCTLPTGFAPSQLEGLVATQLADSLRKSDAFWGDGYVKMTYVNESRVHFRTRFESKGGRWNDDTFWVDFDLDLSCAEGNLAFEPTNVDVDYDLSPQHDAKLFLGLIAATVVKSLRDDVQGALDQIYGIGDRVKGASAALGSICPTAEFESDGNLKLDWSNITALWSFAHGGAPFPSSPLCRPASDLK